MDYCVFYSLISIYKTKNFISNDVRDTKTSDPKLIAVALTFKSVDPLGVSEYLILYLFAFVDLML